MFHIASLKQSLMLEPDAYSYDIEQTLNNRLVSMVEGSCSGDYGYIITVLSVLSISEGLVQHTGQTVFEIRYKALTLNVSRGDVVDAMVSETNRMGIFATIGPLTIFISNYQIPNTFNTPVKNSLIRLRIIGTRVEATRIFAIGTLNEDFLGAIY